jgi:hypothetical protein
MLRWFRRSMNSVSTFGAALGPALTSDLAGRNLRPVQTKGGHHGEAARRSGGPMGRRPAGQRRYPDQPFFGDIAMLLALSVTDADGR